MLFVLLSKRFLHMTVLAGFAFVAIRANLLGCYKYQNTFLSWKRILFSSKDFFLFYDETFFMMRNSYQNIVNLLNIFCAFGIIQVVNTTGCIHIISFGICLNHMFFTEKGGSCNDSKNPEIRCGNAGSCPAICLFRHDSRHFRPVHQPADFWQPGRRRNALAPILDYRE